MKNTKGSKRKSYDSRPTANGSQIFRRLYFITRVNQILIAMFVCPPCSSDKLAAVPEMDGVDTPKQ